MSPVSPLARFAGSIYHWARDHRVHHKHSEQDADPHNATRGFFFAHMGWLYVKKHPAVVEAGKLLNFDDLKADGTVMFQKRYDPWFTLFMCFVFPALVAKYCWGEEFWPALHVGRRVHPSPDPPRNLLGPVSRLKTDLNFIFKWWKFLLTMSRF